MRDNSAIVFSEPLTADELTSVVDPRYVGLNRAQRRKAQAAERKASKHGRI